MTVKNPVMTEQREVTIGDVRYTRRTWADGSVQHYRHNRRQACLVKLDARRSFKVCAAIDAALAPTASERWKELTAKAEETGNWPIRSAYMCAEGNAADTFAENGRADDLMDPRAADALANLAFDSLSLTPEFIENEAVRDFYVSIGYRW
jgi:hypothetical protein